MTDKKQGKRCELCGTMIRIPIARGVPGLMYACNACWEIRETTISGACVSGGHWDDDPSGASGSWDNAVRLTEDSL